MAVYTEPPAVVTGQTMTATNWNDWVRTNFQAMWVWTTAGDIAYASAANRLSRLGIGATGALLCSTGSAPTWLAPSAAGQVLTYNGTNAAWASIARIHAIGRGYTDTDAAVTGTTWGDVSGMSVSLTLSATCTIIVLIHGTISAPGGAVDAYLRPVIDGTADSNGYVRHNLAGYSAAAVVGYKKNVAAGARICKLQMRSGVSGETAHWNTGAIIAVAFEE